MIRRLSRSIREYKRYAILAPLMMVGEVAMEVLIPTLMAGFMDSGVKTDDMSYVLRQGGLLLLCAMASLCFGILSATFASRAAAGFAKNLRKDMFYKVQTYSLSLIHILLDHWSVLNPKQREVVTELLKNMTVGGFAI